jgi:hypothetical protein
MPPFQLGRKVTAKARRGYDVILRNYFDAQAYFYYRPLSPLFFSRPPFAQNHVSVPLDDALYRIIEQAEMRGLCDPLPGM